MKEIAVISVYLAMSIFDLIILAGTVYLVIDHNWSAWWFVLSVSICAGSSPRRLLESVYGAKA